MYITLQLVSIERRQSYSGSVIDFSNLLLHNCAAVGDGLPFLFTVTKYFVLFSIYNWLRVVGI